MSFSNRKLTKHQIKTRWYYWFWSICAVAVVGGQVYVGSGYRQMSKSFDRIIDTIVVTLELETNGYPFRYAPREMPSHDDHPMVIK
tara:strand:+ start:1225 stop:1482 length:258 start_codon:yes stop_codon:yes gene_type:complete